MLISRMVISVPVASVITLSLFLVMITLVANRDETTASVSITETIRILAEPRTEESVPTIPDHPIETEIPDPPPIQEPIVRKIEPTDGPRIVRFDPGPIQTSGLTDVDALPEIRFAPEYPDPAYNARIEGFVTVQFDVSASGAVENISVLIANPAGYFEKAAVKAVARWKYRPKTINGKAVRRQGFQTRITFQEPAEGW